MHLVPKAKSNATSGLITRSRRLDRLDHLVHWHFYMQNFPPVEEAA
jgi:hypothetical protein